MSSVSVSAPGRGENVFGVHGALIDVCGGRGRGGKWEWETGEGDRVRWVHSTPVDILAETGPEDCEVGGRIQSSLSLRFVGGRARARARASRDLVFHLTPAELLLFVGTISNAVRE